MSDEQGFRRTLSIRLSEKLTKDLQRAAAEESNPPSAVARRLLSAGLERQKADRRTTNDPPEAA
jgi:predicted transcriptional regulator